MQTNMLPKAGLPNILNSDDSPATNSHPPPHLRDSGFYSTPETSSKRMSALVARKQLAYQKRSIN